LLIPTNLTGIRKIRARKILGRERGYVWIDADPLNEINDTIATELRKSEWQMDQLFEVTLGLNNSGPSVFRGTIGHRGRIFGHDRSLNNLTINGQQNVWPAPSASSFLDLIWTVCINVSGPWAPALAKMEIRASGSS
jgi:hypothetical protein